MQLLQSPNPLPSENTMKEENPALIKIKESFLFFTFHPCQAFCNTLIVLAPTPQTSLSFVHPFFRQYAPTACAVLLLYTPSTVSATLLMYPAASCRLIASCSQTMEYLLVALPTLAGSGAGTPSALPFLYDNPKTFTRTYRFSQRTLHF